MQQPRASEWTRCRAIFFTLFSRSRHHSLHRRAARSHKKSTKQTIFSTMAQEDGSYPRLNASMLHSRQFVGKIVSLVGCVESFDGTNIQLKCADNATISVHSGDAGFNLPPGTFVELVGFVNEDNTVTVSEWNDYAFSEPNFVVPLKKHVSHHCSCVFVALCHS